ALLGRGNAVDGANSTADKGKQEGQALQEFKFFADSRKRPAAARDVPAAKGAAGSLSERSERPAAARVDLAAKGAAGSRSERSERPAAARVDLAAKGAAGSRSERST